MNECLSLFALPLAYLVHPGVQDDEDVRRMLQGFSMIKVILIRNQFAVVDI